MAFVRKIKKGKSVYLALVENYRKDGKVRQRVLKYLGKEIDGKAFKKVYLQDIKVDKVKRYGDILVVDKISAQLGLKKMFEKYSKEILLLVYSHLLDKTSISNLEKWTEDTYLPEILEMSRISTKRIYQALEYLNELKFEAIEKKIYEKGGGAEPEAVIVDVTDTYFTGEKGGADKARRGKDGKYEKLLQISLAINKRSGFPIFHRTYEGNISDIHILKDMAAGIKERGIKKFVIIDRGMTSKENMNFLNDLGFEVIGGLKRTKRLSEIIDKTDREEIYHPQNRVKLINTTVYCIDRKVTNGRVIIVYNPHMELVRRELLYERKGAAKKAKYLGYSFIFTNTNITKEETLKAYYERDLIERTFRQMKGILNLRPIRVWLKEHVQAHIKICYLSYAILSMFADCIKDLDISSVAALHDLKTSYIVALSDPTNNFVWKSVVLKNIQKVILNKVGVVYNS